MQTAKHELRIAVNGARVSSLKVSSELSELDLNLTEDNRIEFVEVSSEQGVQLLFFTVDHIGPQREQWAWIKLSEGRSLKVCFRNESGPSLSVVYKDPALKNAFANGDAVDTHTLSSPLLVVPNVDNLLALNVTGGRVRSCTSRLIDPLRCTVRRPLVAEETATRTASETLLQSLKSPLRTV